MRTAADLVSDSESGNAREARGDANPAVGATLYYGASGGISRDAKLVRRRHRGMSTMHRNEVIARLKEVEPALRGHGAQALYLFGSHAQDEASAESDIDVFIDKDRSRQFGFDEFMDIYFLLRERLGENIDYGTREGLSPALRAEIEQEAIRIF